jgi:hypothetical protein
MILLKGLDVWDFAGSQAACRREGRRNHLPQYGVARRLLQNHM